MDTGTLWFQEENCNHCSTKKLLWYLQSGFTMYPLMHKIKDNDDS